MGEFLSTLAFGILVSIIGLLNMSGNISTLHRYHRHRVAREDIKPFGMRVGLGTLIFGLAAVLCSIFLLIGHLTHLILFKWIGFTILGVSVLPAIVIIFRAVIKYNKGLF